MPNRINFKMNIISFISGDVQFVEVYKSTNDRKIYGFSRRYTRHISVFYRLLKIIEIQNRDYVPNSAFIREGVTI